MKVILFSMLALGSLTLFAQQPATTPQPAKKPTLAGAIGYPDEAIKKDQKGQVITNAAFSDSLMLGTYFFDPMVKDEKITEMTLRVAGPEEMAAMKGIIRSLSFKPTPAPDFTLKDMTGKTYQLSQLKDKTLVLNFWFTACMPCVKEIPSLNGLVESNKDVVFLAITNDQSERVNKFLLKHPFAYRIITNAGEVTKKYEITAYPSHYVIKNGIITNVFIGDGSMELLKEAIRNSKN